MQKRPQTINNWKLQRRAKNAEAMASLEKKTKKENTKNQRNETKY